MPIKVRDAKTVSFSEMERLLPLATELPYIREERGGYYSLLGLDGDMNYTMLNQTGHEILGLCDGRRTVGAIAREMEQRYPSTEPVLIESDLVEILLKLTSIKAVLWRMDKTKMATDPLGTKLEERLADGSTLRLMREDDLPAVSEAIEKFGSAEPGAQLLYAWESDLERYGDRVAIRQRLFDYSADYFMVSRDGSAEGLLMVELDSDPRLNGARVALAALPWGELSRALPAVLGFCACMPGRRIASLSVFVPASSAERDPAMVREFEASGFALVDTVPDGYGEDEDLIVYRISTGRS